MIATGMEKLIRLLSRKLRCLICFRATVAQISFRLCSLYDKTSKYTATINSDAMKGLPE